MKRRLSFLAFVLLAGCGGSAAESEQEEAAAASGDDRIECALAGASAFERRCLVERTSGDEGVILTLRHPSGSFRRLLITADGRGVVAADGAHPAVVTPLSDDMIEVVIAGDRFRLPATVK